MAKFKPLPPLAELREAFDYDPNTGLFLHRHSTQYKPDLKGKVAGTINKNGYVALSLVRGKFFYGHRAAWYIVTGQDPLDSTIDHIDRNRSNNKWNNLRISTYMQNAQNQSCRGFCWDKSRQKYIVSVRAWGKTYFVGRFLTIEEARAAYDAKAVELRGEFAPQECRQDSA